MANNVKNKKRSKGFFIRLISGISLALIAVTTSVSVMVPSYVKWKNYYDDVMAEKAEKDRLNALPLEFLGISAELDKKIKYYDNETADPEKSDFIVRANFTEKGKAFSKRVSVDDYEMIVPEDFAKKGGTIKFTYTYTPEKKDGETETPDSITKETELTIKLIEPDETVFKIVKMPTFTDPLREIDAASVKEYALQRGAAELSDDFVHEACQRVMELAKPQATCQQCFYDNTSHMVLCDSPFTINSPTVCQRIEDSAIVLMYAVTLGEALEKEVDALFMNKEITRGLALDSALTVATAGYTKQLIDMLDEAGADKGYKASWIMNPGTGDWPSGQMANIAQAVHAEQIGVSLLPSGMLMPRKTVTGVIGLNFIGGGCSGSCSACAMAGHCGE